MVICRETHFFHYVYSRRRWFGDLGVVKNRQRLVDAFLALERTRRMRIDLAILRSHLLREATDYRSFYAALLRFYAESRGKRRTGEQRADHRLAETYGDWFPDARILHMVRDPRDVVESLMRMPWAPKNVATNARWWLKPNLAMLPAPAGPRYLQVKYEKLVRHPEVEIPSICAFVGEPHTPGLCLPAGEPAADRPWLERAQHAVDPSRVGVWRDVFSRAEIGLIEWIVGRHLEVFGYQPEGLPPTAGARLTARVRESIQAARRRMDEFPGSLYYAMRSTNLAGEEAAKNRSRSSGAATI